MMKREQTIAELRRDLIATVIMFSVIMIGAWLVVLVTS